MRRVMQNTLNVGGASVVYVAQAIFQACTAYTTTCQVIPIDNTKPENTEGIEIVDCPITPLSTGHTLRVEVNWNGLVSKGPIGVAALFHSSSTMARAVGYMDGTAIDLGGGFNFNYQEAAPATTSQSYSLRVGISTSGKILFVNGNTAGQLYNGALFCSINVTELATG